MAGWLHVTNGDGAADLIKDSRLPGDVLPWRDVMHHGPFPAGKSLEELADIRAGYLAGEVLNRDEVKLGFELRDAHFRGAGRYDEMILWFEHDLLDQLQLIQILDLIPREGLKEQTKISLICIGEYPGIEPFRGLGQLTLEQAAGLIDQRQSVTEEMYRLAEKSWTAFCSETPAAIETLLSEEDFSSLPFLEPCLKRQLQEFPWINDGLTRSERQFMQMVSEGVSNPVRLFIDNMDLETHLFMGDWHSFDILDRLTQGTRPLLKSAPGKFRYPPRDEIEIEDLKAQLFSLTDHGHAVLTGECLSEIMRDEWLGGVHLSGKSPKWLWDEEGQRLKKIVEDQ